MRRIQQINNLSILHDRGGSENLFVRTPDGRLWEEFRVNRDQAYDTALAKAQKFCRNTPDFTARA